ncbi:MAG TPA: tetratricopeptide repeat protein [Tepidisphaeraceae bacterium]|nr:tetratricopeptide repeat protein [Tepidisphaeraceae bacterium]
MPTLREAIQLAIQQQNAGRLDQAEAIYRKVLAGNPKMAEVIQLLAIVLHQQNRNIPSLEQMDRAIAINPNSPDFHLNRGTVLVALNRWDDAIEAFDRAIRIKPDYAQALLNQSQVLASRGRLEEAESHLWKLVELQPSMAIARAHLANMLWKQFKIAECIAEYRQAVQLDPMFAGAWNNLAIALQKQGNLDEAMDAFSKSAQLQPTAGGPIHAIGNIMIDQGLLDGAIAQYRRAIQMEPLNPAIHSTLLCTLHYDPKSTLDSLKQEHAEFSRRFEAPLSNVIKPFAGNKDPNRKLRIGYVSPDFYFHAECYFVVPLLEAHDKRQFEVHCYSSVAVPDLTTERLTKAASSWHDVISLDDAQLANRIRKDGIDILVDLTMHTPANRALVFARKPAPIQVSWLAYPGSTGLQAMDYRITDRFIDPPGADNSWSTEKCARLDDAWVCWVPISEYPDVGPLPAELNQSITFGSLNKLCKINDDVLTVWSQILQAVPNSTLMLLSHEGTHRQRFLDRTLNKGIARERIRFEPPRARVEYLELYNQIDIGLDPFPYNGITTTCDAMWMGVPVLTLPGMLPVSRAGLSLLSNNGLTELVAGSPDDLVRLAADLTTDLSRLKTLRSFLRQRLQDSPILDAKRFARGMESAYRTMWQRYCAT